MASQLFEGDRRFDIVVRLPEQMRVDPIALQDLPIPCPTLRTRTGRAGATLGDRADRAAAGGCENREPARTKPDQPRERKAPGGGHANVRDRDLGGFVEDLQQRIEQQVSVPEATGSTTAARSSS